MIYQIACPYIIKTMTKRSAWMRVDAATAAAASPHGGWRSESSRR